MNIKVIKIYNKVLKNSIGDSIIKVFNYEDFVNFLYYQMFQKIFYVNTKNLVNNLE